MPRFHIPLVEPDVGISRIRLSDGRRLQAHAARSARTASPEAQACSGVASFSSWKEVIGLRHSPDRCPLHKHIRSQAPSLRRRYPVSQVLRACPPPHTARTVTGFRLVHVHHRWGLPPACDEGRQVLRRSSLYTCRRHYPGGTVLTKSARTPAFPENLAVAFTHCSAFLTAH